MGSVFHRYRRLAPVWQFHCVSGEGRFLLSEMRRHRRKMPATTADGRMASGLRGGIARARTKEIAKPLPTRAWHSARIRKSPAGNASALQKTIGKKPFASPYTPFHRLSSAAHAFRFLSSRSTQFATPVCALLKIPAPVTYL